MQCLDSVLVDRIGVCDWLCKWMGENHIDECQRRAVYAAIAIVSAPQRFTHRHFAELTFKYANDQSDVGGKCYCDYVCKFRFSPTGVTVRWRHDACDDYCGQSVHTSGRLVHGGSEFVSFADFIEKVKCFAVIGKLSGYAYMTGGTRITGGEA